MDVRFTSTIVPVVIPVAVIVTLPVFASIEIPSPAVIYVTPVPPGKLVNNDPSPINLLALIEEAVTCCDDTKEANKDPVLIFRDEILLKLLR